jgi:chemotaxis protein CheC
MKLDALTLDALTEIFNIGVGQAADALSQIAGESVLLTVPRVSVLSRSQVTAHMGGAGMSAVSAVRQRFSGVINAEAVLMFPAERGLRLVQMMMGGELPLEQLAEMEQEALSEVGNILLNSVMASVADALNIEFDGALPSVELTHVHTVLHPDHDPVAPVLLIDIHFEVASREVQGLLAFLLDVASRDLLEHMLARFLRGVAA